VLSTGLSKQTIKWSADTLAKGSREDPLQFGVHGRTDARAGRV